MLVPINPCLDVSLDSTKAFGADILIDRLLYLVGGAIYNAYLGLLRSFPVYGDVVRRREVYKLVG